MSKYHLRSSYFLLCPPNMRHMNKSHHIFELIVKLNVILLSCSKLTIRLKWYVIWPFFIFIWILISLPFATQIFFIPSVSIEWIVEFSIIGSLFGLLPIYSVVFYSLNLVCYSSTPMHTISQFDVLSLWVHLKMICVHV